MQGGSGDLGRRARPNTLVFDHNLTIRKPTVQGRIDTHNHTRELRTGRETLHSAPAYA